MNIVFNLKFLAYNRRIALNKQGVQYLIGVVTALIATLIAYWSSWQIMLVVLLVIGGFIIAFVLLRTLEVGYFFMLAGAIFIPFKGPGGINASMIILICMIFLWLMEKFVVQRRFEFVRSGPIRPAIYFMVVSLVAFGMGQISWFVFAKQAPLDTQFGGFSIYFFSLAAMIMTANLLTDSRWLKPFIWAFLGVGVIYMLCRAANLAFIDLVYARGFTANSMFWTWMVALGLGQAIFNHDLTRRARIVLYLIVALTLIVAIAKGYDWKSGWVPPLIAAGVLIGLRFKKLAFASIPIVLVAVILIAQNLISSDSYSWGTRVDAWLVVLDISRINPLLGMGFANYYWFARLFTIRGFHTSFSSHSQYVDIIAQTGLVGLICFLWLIFEVGHLSWNLNRKLKCGFERGYSHGVFAGLLGSLMAGFLVDWLLPFAYNIGLEGFRASILPWIFFGGLISLEQHYKSENAF
jgi:hypothetical protein